MKILDRLVAVVGLAILFLIGITAGAIKPADAQSPPGAIAISNSTADAAATAATATLAAMPGHVTYLCGFIVSGSGATAASVVAITVSNLNSSMTFDLQVPAGATVALPAQPNYTFSPCLPGNATNTAVTVGIPSLGTGNLHSSVTAWGFQN